MLFSLNCVHLRTTIANTKNVQNRIKINTAPGKECSEKPMGIHRLVVLVISMSVRYLGKKLSLCPVRSTHEERQQ